MKKSRMSAPAVAGGPKHLDWRPWALGALLVAVTAAAYSNSFSGPFIFDDITSIPDNPHIRQLWPLREAMSGPPESTVASRPIACLSLAVNYAIGGLRVRGYHVFNLTVHLCSALLLTGIIRRTLLAPSCAAGGYGHDAGQRTAPWLAAVAAAIWALHPLQTEAVTYVVQRTELLMGLFYLLTLYCAIRGWGSSRRAIWFAASVVSCALGMASKEAMATAPVLVLLYDRTFISRSWGTALRRHAGLYLGLAATWVIVGALVASGSTSATIGLNLHIRPWDYLATQAGVILWYLRLCFWPDPLVISYADWEIVHRVAQFLLPGLVILVLLAGTVLALWRRPALGFLGAAFFLLLAPTSSFVPIVTEFAAERRMYLPLAAVAVVAALGGYWLWQQWAARVFPRANWQKWVGGSIVIGVAGVLAGLTFQRNRDYQSGISIWEDAVRKRPGNVRAHYNLGQQLVDAGELAPAQEHFLLSVQQKPDYADAHVALGCVRARLGRPEEAIADFDRAIQAAPHEANGYYNRAVVYFALGRFEATIDDCNAAIVRKAGYASAYYERGLAQQKLMRTEPAVASFTEAIRLRPSYTAAFGERAISYCFLQRYDDAWADVRMFRRLGGTPNPKFIERLSHASGRAE